MLFRRFLELVGEGGVFNIIKLELGELGLVSVARGIAPRLGRLGPVSFAGGVASDVWVALA